MDTLINELMNRPRIDIDGSRYGNTLSDDMFALKNPSWNGHTPESYDYLNQPYTEEAPAGLMPAGLGEIPSLSNPGFVSRQKNITDNGVGASVDKGWGLMDDILEYPEYYTGEQLQWAQGERDKRISADMADGLSTEGYRAEQFGNAPDEEWPRMGAEWDPYLGATVDYSSMSPETLEQLAKMGVNRPQTEDDLSVKFNQNGNETYNSLLNLYRMALENGWR